jgi:hypothetical protein
LKNIFRFFPFSICLFFFLSASFNLRAQGKNLDDHIVFINYPDFPEAHSTWDDIGYSKEHNKVLIGVTNHSNKVVLYEYDVSKNQMNKQGALPDLAHLRSFQWQGKIHSKFAEGPGGQMYFSTDGGESREEYLMNNPHGYSGGFFMKWDPGKHELTNLGMGLQYESVKDIDVDYESGVIYGVTYPQAHFLVYDPVKNILRDLGRLGSSHVPRVLFTDWWGNCYYVDWRQRLVKFDKQQGGLVFAKNSLPAFPGTPGTKIVTGITAYAKDQQNGVIYLITYGSKILAFYPEKEGIGEIKDLGPVAQTGTKNLYDPYVPNLNIDTDGKLYYIVGGHGNYVIKDTTVLIQFDPHTKRQQILYKFPVSELSEATGSDTRDDEGNLYFAGRKDIQGNHGSSPFLIKFNPTKPVK